MVLTRRSYVRVVPAAIDFRTMIDFVIVLAIVAGMVAGWRKGLILPLVAQAGALLGFAFVFAGPLSANVPSGPLGLGAGVVAGLAGSYVLGTVGSIGIGLLYHFAAFKRVDKVLGVPLGGVGAALTMYVALLATVTLDGWLAPLHSKSAVTSVDAQALAQVVAANPAAGTFVDPVSVSALVQAAAKTPVAIDQLAKINAGLALYETNFRPQLVNSRIASTLFSLGAQLPFIGTTAAYPSP